MEIIKTEEAAAKKITLQLVGWLDTLAAPELEAAVEELDEASLEKVVMDLEKLEYISSFGLRQFVADYKKLRNKLVFRNVSDNIMGILKTTGLDKRLVFE